MKSNEQSIKEGNEMSIEQNLERIANGVEELVKLAKSNPAQDNRRMGRQELRACEAVRELSVCQKLRT